MKKKNKVEGLTLSDFKTYYKTVPYYKIEQTYRPME